MVCLESDFLIAFLRRNEAAIDKMKILIAGNEELCFTPITATELFQGAAYSKSADAEAKVEELLSTMQLLDFDLLAAKKAGNIIARLSKCGEQIGDMDSLIAAIAIRHNQTILTRNKKHFARIPGAKITEW